LVLMCAVVDLSVGRSAITRRYPAKTAVPTEMPFGMWACVDF